MERQEQGVLLEIPEQPEREAAQTAGSPKLKPIDRQQGLLRTVIVEELVPENHKVRAIWGAHRTVRPEWFSEKDQGPGRAEADGRRGTRACC